METKLERIAEISANTKKPEFTALYHHISYELLKKCHKELDGKKAVGIDKVTKDEYEQNLDANLKDLDMIIALIIYGIPKKKYMCPIFTVKSQKQGFQSLRYLSGKRLHLF